MDLVEVNRVNFEPTETVFAFLPDGGCFQHFVCLALLIPFEPAFGENVRPASRPAFQRLRDNLLRMAQAIYCGGINPVYAQLERAMDRRYRFVVILFSPAELPTGAANCPGAEAYGRDK
jgi:hypothetical protein